MNWQGKWIWAAGQGPQPVNQTIWARKRFELPEIKNARLLVTADSQYRVFINGQWVEDGPARAWPEHYQYDVIDTTELLKPGENIIAVMARYFGQSNFHQAPQEAGLLAQLEVETASGQRLIIGTDESWKARVSPAHEQRMARVSIQMERGEWYDARKELPDAACDCPDESKWPAAEVVYEAEAGPWKDLHERDVAFLTKEPIYPERLSATLVRNSADPVVLDLKRLCYPNDRSSNGLPMAGVFATLITSDAPRVVGFSTHMFGGRAFCRGLEVTEGKLQLEAGDNLLVLLQRANSHDYDFGIAPDSWEGLALKNPAGEDAESAWLFIGPVGALEERPQGVWPTGFPFASDPMPAMLPYAEARTAEELLALAGEAAKVVPADCVLKDSYLPFFSRQVVGDATGLVEHRRGLLSDNSEWTTVFPSEAGDVELALDFGREVVGWVEFELDAPEATIVDANLIEYREGDRLQHTYSNRNGFRYITKAGLNRYVAQKRRAGRYLFLTLRSMTGPVRIRRALIIQATYPVEMRGSFLSSNAAFNRIWEISAYTLRLCMEDTFTDCPLYEQTLWVGDARNESLFNFVCYGAEDISLRCLRLTGQSLERYPIAGCQVPSGWDCLLPAWSWLWGLNAWEYYFATGDKSGLEELYPWVIQNLEGARQFCLDRGLFSMSAWNMFDWTPIDDQHRTVLHNSLFAVGAIDAALKCCEALGKGDTEWLLGFREELSQAILALWDESKGSYPDSIHEDGTVSPKTSQHTSVLGLLYDVLPEGKRQVALANVLQAPEEMTQVGSPFALQFFLEALMKEDKSAEAIQLIASKWQDMLDCDASTCWETFRGRLGSWPTRSYCHAWSSAPLFVFNQVLLGLQITGVAASQVEVSPHPVAGVSWAQGSTWSPRGELKVAWRLEGETLSLDIDMPEGVEWKVIPNADWQGVARVLVNGEEQSGLV